LRESDSGVGPILDLEPARPIQPGLGLRLRLWFACTAGGIVGAATVLWIASSLAPSDALLNPGLLGIWPWSAALACIIVGIALAIWLDYGLVIHLRGVSRALELRNPTALRGLPSVSGWGEVSTITEQIQDLISRQRENDRAVRELEELRQRLRALRAELDRLPPGDRAVSEAVLTGPLSALIESLNRRLAVDEDSRGASRRAALEAREDILHAVDDARDSAEQAERGFIEATALISTVRELQRLGVELENELAARPAGPAALPATESSVDAMRETAAQAIEDLVVASTESVERLAHGLLKVQAIGEQVQQLGNRATMIALHVALDRGAGAPGEAREAGAPAAPTLVPAESLAPELKSLAREVREVTERTSELSREIDRDAVMAMESMQGVRERVAERLERMPVPEPQAPTAPTNAPRLLERMREMIEDAASKAERLAGSGERVSRAAERLVHRLEEEALAMEMLATSVGATPTELSEPPPTTAPTRTPNLRLLGPEDLPDERQEPPAPGRGEDS
jgi:DNA repair exonuclease SbcCD ATPase subunit